MKIFQTRAQHTTKSLFTLSNIPAFFLSYVLFDFSLLFSNCELFAFDLEMQEK